MKDSLVLKKNPDIVSRTIEDETILMPLYRSSQEINCIYTLNEAAARIWGLINGKNNVGSIKKKLMAEYEVTEKEMDIQMQKFIDDLLEISAVKSSAR